MKTEYSVFRLKLFGFDDPKLNPDNCHGYGAVIGEEWVGNYWDMDRAVNVISRLPKGRYTIKTVYVNE
jgi:hypothetical protein